MSAVQTQDSESNQSPSWHLEIQTIQENYQVSPGEGLLDEEAQRRLRQYGPNKLRTRSRRNAWKILGEQFKSIIIWLLLISAGLSFIFAEVVDGIAVIIVVILNTAIGFVTELRAVRSMEALRDLSQVEAIVIRAGKQRKVPAEKVVPGDILHLAAGDLVTADVRLLEASKLQADESTLTGESEPVAKHTDSIAADKPLAERSNMAFKGTAITRGSGLGIVVATGMDTELGRITSLVAEAEDEHTPLEKRLDRLGHKLVWVTLGIIIIVALAGILRGKDFILMIETAVALAVAAVPEGLPIVATIALARGMTRMARNNALINRLASVETLGGTNVVCTDKTGTLTENQMTVTRIILANGIVNVSGQGLTQEGEFKHNGVSQDLDHTSILHQILETVLLCNNATLPDSSAAEDHDARTIGEPLEVALLVAGAKAGLSRPDILSKLPEAREIAFDPDSKMMATYHETGENFRIAVKGAPEAVLDVCHKVRHVGEDQDLDKSSREEWLETNRKLAAEGLRMVAVANKTVSSIDTNPYQELVLLGLIAMHDPPRQDVRGSLQACRQAGVQVVMVTGDQALTAQNIGLSVGLVEDSDTDVMSGTDLKPPQDLSANQRQKILSAPIFARVSPAQKLDLIAVHQSANKIVAMTGDGVNDAPALKKADIGIAMGLRGTQVAKEASDMVLKDDAFGTIVLAIRLGRVIFTNIRRFVIYLISCNISEILVVFLASLANLPLPIRPLQILFLNLVTDVFPALALCVSRGDPAVMRQPPRDPQESILTRRHWTTIGVYSLTITLVVLAAFGLASSWLGADQNRVVSISFLTLAFAQLWHVFNMRTWKSDLFRNDIIQNPFVWGAVVLSLGLLMGAVYWPPLADVLNLVDPGQSGWVLVVGMSLIPLILGQIAKSLPVPWMD